MTKARANVVFQGAASAVAQSWWSYANKAIGIRKLETSFAWDLLAFAIQHVVLPPSLARLQGSPGMSEDRGDPGLAQVRTRPYGLKDVGKAGFPIPPMAKWIGFEVVDGVRVLEVHVEDIALQHLDPTARGANQIITLEVHRNEIFKIAVEKYKRGLIDFGGVIRVAYADVAR